MKKDLGLCVLLAGVGCQDEQDPTAPDVLAQDILPEGQASDASISPPPNPDRDAEYYIDAHIPGSDASYCPDALPHTLDAEPDAEQRDARYPMLDVPFLAVDAALDAELEDVAPPISDAELADTLRDALAELDAELDSFSPDAEAVFDDVFILDAHSTDVPLSDAEVVFDDMSVSDVEILDALEADTTPDSGQDADPGPCSLSVTVDEAFISGAFASRLDLRGHLAWVGGCDQPSLGQSTVEVKVDEAELHLREGELTHAFNREWRYKTSLRPHYTIDFYDRFNQNISINSVDFSEIFDNWLIGVDEINQAAAATEAQAYKAPLYMITSGPIPQMQLSSSLHFTIKGKHLEGDIDVEENDSTGALVSAIESQFPELSARVDHMGRLIIKTYSDEYESYGQYSMGLWHEAENRISEIETFFARPRSLLYSESSIDFIHTEESRYRDYFPSTAIDPEMANVSLDAIQHSTTMVFGLGLLSVNDVEIRRTVHEDDPVSSIENAYSAIAWSQAINEVSEVTGVSATPTETGYWSSRPAQYTYCTMPACTMGGLHINNDLITMNPPENIEALVEQVNERSESTGIIGEYIPENQRILLVARDGRNIHVEADQRFEREFGLVTEIARGRIAFTSEATFTLKSGSDGGLVVAEAPTLPEHERWEISIDPDGEMSLLYVGRRLSPLDGVPLEVEINGHRVELHLDAELIEGPPVSWWLSPE